jgi:hypothetical protein
MNYELDTLNKPKDDTITYHTLLVILRHVGAPYIVPVPRSNLDAMTAL